MATPGQFVANAMLSGYQQGVAQREGKKEQRRELDLQTQLQEHETNIGNLQQKYSSQLGPKGEDTPESLKTKYALSQALQARNALTSESPKAGAVGKIGQKIGEVLHLAKKPEAQSVTVQPAAVSAPAEGVTLAATPAYSASAASAPASAQPASSTAASGGGTLPENVAGQNAGVDRTKLVSVAKGMNKVFPAKAGYHLVSNPAEHQKIYYQSDTNFNDVIPATAHGVGNRAGRAAVPTPQQSGGALPKNRFANPEDQPPDVSFSFNKQFAKPGPYVTTLSPQQEQQFQAWAQQHPDLVEGELNTSTPDYDVRGRWLGEQRGDPAAKLTKSALDGKLHAHDKWKTPYNATFSNESVYAKPNAPHWQGDKLVAPDGTLLVDETPKGIGALRTQAQAQGAVQSAAGEQPRRIQTEPGTAEAALPPMQAAAPALPAGKPTTVKGPAQNPAQLRAQAQANQRAQLETEELTAAAPLTAQQQAIQQAQAGTAGKIEAIRGGLEAIRTFNPKATPEELQALNNRYLDGVLGTTEKSALKPLPGAKPYKGTDGRYYQPMQDTLTKAITAEAMPEGYQPPPGNPSKSQFNEALGAYARAHDVAVDDLPPEAYDYVTRKLALDRAMPSSSTTTSLKQNADGMWVPVTETNYRSPGGGVKLTDPLGTPQQAPPATGAAPSAGAAKPPAAAPGETKIPAGKKPATAVPAKPAGAAATAPKAARPARVGSTRVGAPLFAAPNKDYTETKATYQAAVDRMSTMDKNLASALKGDQQAMLSLVANHIGMTLGGQKGARINQAVWNEAVETSPWIPRQAARFDSRGLLVGVTLAPEQMRQMVNLAHEKVDVLKDHLNRLQQELNLGGQAAPQGGGSLVDRLNNALGGK
jgi:hypothetical protein